MFITCLAYNNGEYLSFLLLLLIIVKASNAISINKSTNSYSFFEYNVYE